MGGQPECGEGDGAGGALEDRIVEVLFREAELREDILVRSGWIHDEEDVQCCSLNLGEAARYREGGGVRWPIEEWDQDSRGGLAIV
jgi:hypothetical protein